MEAYAIEVFFSFHQQLAECIVGFLGAVIIDTASNDGGHRSG